MDPIVAAAITAVPDHSANLALADVLKECIPKVGDSNTEIVRKANKRVKLTETSLTAATSADLAKEHIYRHKVITRVVSNEESGDDDATVAATVVTMGQLTAACLEGGVIANAIATAVDTVTTAVNTALMVERVHSYNAQNAQRINCDASAVTLLPKIERGARRGATPTYAELALPSDVRITKTYLSRLSRDSIQTIHSVYNDPTFGDDIPSVTVRRANLATFFFGFDANTTD